MDTPLPPVWRLLQTEPRSGADNMALDHALMRYAARTGHGVLRVYSWRAPTISLGRHQRSADVIDPARAATLGLDVVRRPTGGRAVVHGREVTYSVAAPARPGGITRDDYAQINQILLDGLRRLGADAMLAERGMTRAPRPHGSPCFDTATEGEIVIQGRKLAGSAQWRDGDALLQHGSILIDDDQSLLAPSRANASASASVGATATLRAALGHAPSPGDVAHALFDAVRTLADPAARCLEPDRALRDATDQLRTHYADPAWTWRR
jgi:lipoate-protein ligase A